MTTKRKGIGHFKRSGVYDRGEDFGDVKRALNAWGAKQKLLDPTWAWNVSWEIIGAVPSDTEKFRNLKS